MPRMKTTNVMQEKGESGGEEEIQKCFQQIFIVLIYQLSSAVCCLCSLVLSELHLHWLLIIFIADLHCYEKYFSKSFPTCTNNSYYIIPLFNYSFSLPYPPWIFYFLSKYFFALSTPPREWYIKSDVGTVFFSFALSKY